MTSHKTRVAEAGVREVPVRALKDRLSEYLRLAEAGTRVVVTSHGRALADLSPHRDGIRPAAAVPVRKATLPWGSVKLARSGRGRTDSVALLVEERRRR